MEMLRQHMLDCNPLLREIADNLGFEDAFPETLQDIEEGFAQIANDAKPLPEELSKMTDGARCFLERVMESDTPMVVYGEKLENIGTTADNTCKSLNKTGKEISDGTNRLKNDINSAFDSMKSKIASASDSMKEKIGGFIDKIRDAISAVKDFLKSGYNKVSGFFSGGGSGDSGKSYSSRSYSMRSMSAPYVHSVIANLQNIEIPKLATGAVLPANREFLALVDDQKHGTNIEAPLDTIRQASEKAVLNILSRFGLNGNIGNSNLQTIIVKQYLDGKQVAGR